MAATTTKTYVDAIAKIVARAVADARQATTVEFIAHLEEHIEVDDDLRAILEAFKARQANPVDEANPILGQGDRPPKRKQPPNAYNMYIKAKIAEIKASNPDIKSGQRLMQLATIAYKEEHPESESKKKSKKTAADAASPAESTE